MERISENTITFTKKNHGAIIDARNSQFYGIDMSVNVLNNS